MTAKTRLRRSFLLEWASLVDPDGYWTHPHGMERVLLAWSHLVKLAGGYVMHGRPGPIDLLCKKPTCINHKYVDPVLSIEDLRERFRWALLHRTENELVSRWRKNHGICVSEASVILGRHYKPMNPGAGFACEADVEFAVKRLLSSSDIRLRPQLNNAHKDARWLHRIDLVVCPNGMISWRMRYGYRGDSGWWYQELATQRKHEPPLDSLRRAIGKLEAWAA